MIGGGYARAAGIGRRLLVIGLLLVAPRLAAGPVRAIDGGAEIPAGTVLLVGRIDIHPPLAPLEQIHMRERFRNKVWMVFDMEPKPIAELRYKDHPGSVTVPPNRTFFVAVPDGIEYYLGAVLPLESRAYQDRLAYLPGGVRLQLGGGARALYIGTVRYVRNEFFDIVRVEIVDDYDAAVAEFQARFGQAHALHKALLQPRPPRPIPPAPVGNQQSL